MITYSFLQHYWWFLISLVGGIFAFLMFVYGGQSMIFSLSKDDEEHKLLTYSLGKKWHYTFTTLVTFGGAFFASFPLFYSTSFGGAYWVWFLLLLTSIFQAVSYEFGEKAENLMGRNTFRTLLKINGLLAPFLVGAALATFFTGSPFSVDKSNIATLTGKAISRWDTPFLGLDALTNYKNWLFGFAVVFLSRTLAVLFFINRLDDKPIQQRLGKQLLINAVLFLVTFLGFLASVLFGEGFAVDPVTLQVFKEPMKYLHNFIQMPLVLGFFLVGVLLVLYSIISSLLNPKNTKGIWFAGVGTVITVTCLLLTTGYNNTPYYPSSSDLNSSLTIQSSSSSPFTLMAMSVVSLIIPIVLCYIFFAWRALEKKKNTIKDATEEDGY